MPAPVYLNHEWFTWALPLQRMPFYIQIAYINSLAYADGAGRLVFDPAFLIPRLWPCHTNMTEAHFLKCAERLGAPPERFWARYRVDDGEYLVVSRLVFREGQPGGDRRVVLPPPPAGLLEELPRLPYDAKYTRRAAAAKLDAADEALPTDAGVHVLDAYNLATRTVHTERLDEAQRAIARLLGEGVPADALVAAANAYAAHCARERLMRRYRLGAANFYSTDRWRDFADTPHRRVAQPDLLATRSDADAGADEERDPALMSPKESLHDAHSLAR